MSTSALKSYARYDDKEKSLSFDGMLGARTTPSVTQATSITTGVTYNAPAGVIITQGATAAAGAEQSFVLTNSYLSGSDRTLLVMLHDYTGGGVPLVGVTARDSTANTATITITNLDAAAALDAALQIRFVVLTQAFA